MHDTESNEQRNHEPQAAIRPELVTQRNSLAAVGMPPRRFREFVRTRGVAHRRVGRLVMVELGVLLDALDRAATNARPMPESDEGAAGDVDEILASLGKRRRRAG